MNINKNENNIIIIIMHSCAIYAGQTCSSLFQYNSENYLKFLLSDRFLTGHEIKT